MNEEFIGLTTLSERAGIGLRPLRYAVDHELIPSHLWFVAEDQIGRPRTFNTVTAILLASAVYLRQAGCKRDAVKALISKAARILRPGRNPLHVRMIDDVAQESGSAVLQVGDVDFVRWIVGKHDTGWLSMRHAKAPPAATATPKVWISIDVGQIRDLIRTGS